MCIRDRLARSIDEAVINTCWLIDADVTTEQRLARWAGGLLHDGQEPPNALDSFGDADASTKEKERVVEGRELGQQRMSCWPSSRPSTTRSFSLVEASASPKLSSAFGGSCPSCSSPPAHRASRCSVVTSASMSQHVLM